MRYVYSATKTSSLLEGRLNRESPFVVSWTPIQYIDELEILHFHFQILFQQQPQQEDQQVAFSSS